MRPIPEMSERDVARFFSKIAVGNPNECWPWKASLSRAGYAELRLGVRKYNAQRIAYTLGFGEDPGEKEVDHACHNRSCCNPNHLRLATRKENMEHLRGARCGSKSGIRGVCRHSGHRRRNFRNWSR